MADIAKIQTLHDNTTGEAVAPRTVVKALSGEGTVGQLVGYTDDNVVGNITPDAAPTEGSVNPVQSGGVYEATKWHSNPNLWDNWYFVGGGSQHGGGQFPINQRGQTEYTAAGYTIDRWLSNCYSGARVLIGENGVVVEGLANFEQRFENDPASGKDLTASFLLSDGTIETVTGKFPDSVSSNDYNATKIHFRYSKTASYCVVDVWFTEGNKDNIAYVAAKLELGPIQTLAHKENGNWVLNDPLPNYATELAKCQRYQLALGIKYKDSGYFTVGYATAHNETTLIAETSLPVTMRGAPSIKYDGTNFATHGGLYTDIGAGYGDGIKITSAIVNQISTNWISLGLYVSPDTPVEQYKIYKIVGRNLDGLPILVIDANL